MQVSSLLLAEEPDTAPAQQSDNTKVNQRDRSNAEPTADRQAEKRSDRELARQIRRAPVFRQLSALVSHRTLFSGRAKSRHGPPRGARCEPAARSGQGICSILAILLMLDIINEQVLTTARLLASNESDLGAEVRGLRRPKPSTIVTA